MRNLFNNQLNTVDLYTLNTTTHQHPKNQRRAPLGTGTNTNKTGLYTQLRNIHYNGQTECVVIFVFLLQFWAAYVPGDTQYKDAVRQTLEQIDVIHRMCHEYPEVFKFAGSSQGKTVKQ